jgi:hypothetical protein
MKSAQCGDIKEIGSSQILECRSTAVGFIVHISRLKQKISYAHFCKNHMRNLTEVAKFFGKIFTQIFAQMSNIVISFSFLQKRKKYDQNNKQTGFFL